MADVSYDVEARLKLSGGGAFKEEMKGAAGAADSLKTIVGGLSSMSGGLTDLASRAMMMGGAFATAGLAAGVAFGTKIAGAVGANLSMLEDKGIQLASVIGAAAEIPFDKARIASGALFDQFKKDAVTSAGETADFVNIASMIAGPILGAGKGMKELHDLTAGVMNTAPAMGVSFQQAGSDVMRMLQGVAGAEQPLFRAMVGIPSLGIQTAEKFNKLDPGKRFAKVAEALGNPVFKAAAAAAGNSMTGLLSTTEDILKTVGGLIGGPIYGLFRKGLGDLTGGALGLLDSDAFKMKLGRIGGEAEIAFKRIGMQLGRIFPSFNDGANNALDLITNLAINGLGKLVDGSKWIADHWDDIKKFAKETATFITDAAKKGEEFVKAMGGGDFATGAKRIAEAMAAQKAASAVAPVVSGGVAVAQGVYGLGKLGAGLLGGGGAAAGATGAVGAATTAGAGAAGGGATAAGAAGTVAAGGGLAALFVAATAAAAAIGGLALAGDQSVKLYNETKGGSNEEMNAASLKSRIDEAALAGDVATVEAFGNRYIGAVRSLYNPNDGDAIHNGMAAARTYIEQVAQQATAAKTELDAAAGVTDTIAAMAMSIQTPVDALVGIYNDATLSGNTALAKMAAGTIVASMTTAADLDKAGLTLAGGIAVFADHLKDAGDGAASQLQHFQNIKPGGDIAGKAAKSAPKGGGGGTITIKWDLGDGNEEAIYVRSRRDIVQMVKAAKGSISGGRVPGVF